MAGRFARKYADLVSSRSKLVVAVILLLTVGVGAGVAVGDMDEAGFGEFEIDSSETEASDFIAHNYAEQDGVISQIVVREEDGNVLSQESILTGLAFQAQIRETEGLSETLDGDGFVGLENLIGTAAYFQMTDNEPGSHERPSVEEQREAVAELSDEAYHALLTTVLETDSEHLGEQDPYQFLPRTYDPGETTANARLTLLLQVDDSSENEEPEAAYAAQVEIGEMIVEWFDDAFIFGQGISDEASSQATGDSFAIITPFAIVIVLLVLGFAYRDILDILLAIAGIAIVLVWMAGIMGWLQIPMNVILIAVPFLLIGLSIDYALHVVMRYREAGHGRLDVQKAGSGPETGGSRNEKNQVVSGRGSNDEISPSVRIRAAMALGLGSVILAITAATFSTGVGFLSNIVSPLPAIQDFAKLSAGGILATFIVFGALIPALKIEIDSFVEGRLGRSRKKPAFGVGTGLANRLLSGVATLAARAPLGVIIVAFLLATGGAYGATTIDTEFNEADFLPEDPPEWTSNLPGPLEPGSYTISDDFEYLSENFQLQTGDSQSQILIRGEVTDGGVLQAIDEATQDIDAETAIALEADGSAAVKGPHTVLRAVASEHEELAQAIADRDSTGNDLPDEDVGPVYDLLFELDAEAAEEVLSRNEAGEITSARVIFEVRAAESTQTIAEDTAAIADRIETAAPVVTAVATGVPVTEAVLQDALLENLVEAFSITLVVILAFLTILFWIKYRSPSLGAIILAPVVGALAWLLGAMALLDIPFNSETAVITSLAIGLGVDYSIHAGERFIDERDKRETLDEALEAAITGTGGALLASAATTAAAFGVLAFSLAPPLQRFGLVTGSAIVFAFFACVTVMPCLLVVRERVKARF